MSIGTRVPCHVCGGAGRFDDVECPTCRTTGLVPASWFDTPKNEPRPARVSSAPAPSPRSELGAEDTTYPPDGDVPAWAVWACVFIAGWAAGPTLTALLERIA